MPFFLTRPQSTLTPTVHPLCPLKPSWTLCARMNTSFYLYGFWATCHSYYSSYLLLPVTWACIVLTWWNVQTGHLGLKWRLYRFQDFYGFCGAIKKPLGAVSEVLSVPLLPEWWQNIYWMTESVWKLLLEQKYLGHGCEWYESEFLQGHEVVKQWREKRLLPLSCSNTN